MDLVLSAQEMETYGSGEYPSHDRGARASDVALGLLFPEHEGYDPDVDRARTEAIYPHKAVVAFLRFIASYDTRHEMNAFTRLPNTEGGRRRIFFEKQSEESDEEELKPAPFCSSCGSHTCLIGAERCARQRRLERQELVTAYIFDLSLIHI